jgi:hypothetical protein
MGLPHEKLEERAKKQGKLQLNGCLECLSPGAVFEWAY